MANETYYIANDIAITAGSALVELAFFELSHVIDRLIPLVQGFC